MQRGAFRSFCRCWRIWALLAVSRTLRGEEESGALDVLLSVPRSRLRVADGEARRHCDGAPVDRRVDRTHGIRRRAGSRRPALRLSAALLFGLNAALLAGVFGAMALLASQFTRARRTAAGITGVAAGLSLVLTSAGRTVPGGDWMGAALPALLLRAEQAARPELWREPSCHARARRALGGAERHWPRALRAPRCGGTRRAARWSAPPERQMGVAGCPLSAWSLRSVFARSLASLSAAAVVVGSRHRHLHAAPDGDPPADAREPPRTARECRQARSRVRGTHREVHGRRRWRHER